MMIRKPVTLRSKMDTYHVSVTEVRPRTEGKVGKGEKGTEDRQIRNVPCFEEFLFILGDNLCSTYKDCTYCCLL
jgi:hypothetical protein